MYLLPLATISKLFDLYIKRFSLHTSPVLLLLLLVLEFRLFSHVKSCCCELLFILGDVFTSEPCFTISMSPSILYLSLNWPGPVQAGRHENMANS